MQYYEINDLEKIIERPVLPYSHVHEVNFPTDSYIEYGEVSSKYKGDSVILEVENSFKSKVRVLYKCEDETTIEHFLADNRDLIESKLLNKGREVAIRRCRG